jgi:hypothetical protein
MMRIFTHLFLLFLLSSSFGASAQECPQTDRSPVNASSTVRGPAEISRDWKSFVTTRFSFRLPLNASESNVKCWHGVGSCYEFQAENFRLSLDFHVAAYRPVSERKGPSFRESVINIDGLPAWKWSFEDKDKRQFHHGALIYSRIDKGFRIGISITSPEELPDHFVDAIFQSIRFHNALRSAIDAVKFDECRCSEMRSFEADQDLLDWHEVAGKLAFTSRISKTTDEINASLVRNVRSKGVSFALDSESEKTLRSLGATDELIATTRESLPRELAAYYELDAKFRRNFDSKDLDEVKLAIEAGSEILDRYICLPSASPMVSYLLEQIPQLEIRVSERSLFTHRTR